MISFDTHLEIMNKLTATHLQILGTMNTVLKEKMKQSGNNDDPRIILRSLNINENDLFVPIPNFSPYYINGLNGIVSKKIKDPNTFIEVKSFYDPNKKQYYVKIKRGKKYSKPCKKYILDLIMSSFDFNFPSITESKITNDTIKHIRPENTIIRVKPIDNSIPFSLFNGRFAPINRGINHPRRKLDNERVQIIRENLGMSFKDFMAKYGDLFGDVSASTVQSVINGITWRVRTKPIQPMTYESEYFPVDKLIFYVIISK